MGKKMRNMLVLAGVQTAQGTPLALTAGANAVLCRSAGPSVINAEFVKRPLIRGAMGNYGSDPNGIYRSLELEVELAGSGTAGTKPGQAALLVGCRMTETLTAGTKVDYQPATTGEKYLTMECYLDGVKFKMTDAIGTVSFEMSPGGYPIAKYKFIGVYEMLTDTPNPTGAVFTTQLKPLLVNKTNTPTFTIDALALPTSAFSLDLANDISWRELINYAAPDQADRNPTASVTVELGTVAAKNWGETIKAGTAMPLLITHGLTAGNIVKLSAPKLMVNAEPSLSDDKGNAMLQMNLDVTPTSGNDELTITFQ
ncbi:MAG: hypothetical protein JNK17_02115 [Hydrogenophaga sp.]|nr:hypothetical protein [Hydrogenophaga sp.]